MKSIILSPQSPTRLDLLLAEKLDLSRSLVQKMLKTGQIFIPNRTVSAHLLIDSQTEVMVEEAAKPKKTSKTTIELDIIFENDDVLVLNKPAGILVHPTKENDPKPTLMEAVLKYCPKVKKVGESDLRKGVVHRLDREASGVIVFAKTAGSYNWLKRQFMERLNEKIYLVLVEGKVQKENDTINFPIARSKTRGRMAARPTSQEGKEAITHFDVIERFSTSTLLRVSIETGRTHQIRAHMFAIGHPVVGDSLYPVHKKATKHTRLFLHASELKITLPDGERKTFQAPLPEELQQTLDGLKKLG